MSGRDPGVSDPGRSDPAEVDLYRRTFREVLDRPGPPERFNDRLHELGWDDLADEHPALAVGLLFEQQGEALSATPALDLVVARAAGMPDAATAVVHARTMRAPGRRVASGVEVDGVVLAGSSRAATFVVPTDDGLFSFPSDTLATVAVHGFDPTLGLRAIKGTVPASAVVPDAAAAEVTPDGAVVDGVGSGPAAVCAAARRALAHELVGAAGSLLRVAVGQVSDRHQFGRPLAAFQTVKHRLAEVKVSIEGATAVLGAAWREGDEHSAMVAKAYAGRAALTAAKHAQQVCGAIGFTEVHPLPAFVRRAHVLDVLYGSSTALTERLGGQLAAAAGTGALAPFSRPW